MKRIAFNNVALLAISFMLLIPNQANAHGLARYVSTPITPPKDFIWWFPISLFIIFTAIAFLLCRFSSFSKIKSILYSFMITVVFVVTFYMFGRFAATTSTAPEPGLGRPCSVCWGLGWDDVGSLFVFWNLFGIAFLLFWVFVITKLWKNKQKWKIVIPLLIIYIICLWPYIYTGALVHGRVGGYVIGDCERRVEIIIESIINYSKDHNDTFPKANSMKELMETLTPYIDYDQLRLNYSSLDTCPIGGIFDKSPKTYEWDIKFSGLSYPELSYDFISEYDLPITCPYCKRKFQTDAYLNLINYVESLKYRKKMKQQRE